MGPPIDEHEEDAQLIALQQWALSAGASSWMIDLAPYEAARVAGVVNSLIIDPRRGALEAVVDDGTSQIVARWHIGRSAPQLALNPGRMVVLQGMVAPGEPHLMMVDPMFEVRLGATD